MEGKVAYAADHLHHSCWCPHAVRSCMSAWQEVLEGTKDEVKAPQGTVWKAMWRTHGGVFMRTGAIKFVHDCILFIGALVGCPHLAVRSLLHDVENAASLWLSASRWQQMLLLESAGQRRNPLAFAHCAGTSAYSWLVAGPFVLEKLLLHLRSPSHTVSSCAPSCPAACFRLAACLPAMCFDTG